MKRPGAGASWPGRCVARSTATSAARRERTYRQLIDRGDAALARDDTFSAIESFSGAIALKSDAMLGYLKRGQAYRRRSSSIRTAAIAPGCEARSRRDAAIRDLRRAAELDPLAPRPLELLGDVNYALLRYDRGRRALPEATSQLDDRSPRILYKLALAH